MNILQICYVYPPSFSGYGKQLATVNEELSRLDKEVRVEVITAFDRRYHSKCDASGVKVVGLLSNGRDTYKSPNICFLLFCLSLPLIQFKRFIAADTIHVVKAGPEAAIAILLARLLGKPTIVKVAQGEMAYNGKGPFLKRVVRLIRQKVVLKADYIVALSNKVQDDLVTWGYPKTRIVRIGNSVDHNRFLPIKGNAKANLRKQLFGGTVGKAHTVFLYLGAICKRKGVQDILAAIELLRCRTEIAIVFVGPDYQDVDEFQRRLSLIKAKSFVVVDYIQRTDHPERYLQASDCLLLPSYSEGMPNVVLESLACGNPVVVSDISVHKEIVTDDVGFIFRRGEVKSLLDKMFRVAQNKKLRDEMGLASRKLMTIGYSPTIVANQYVRLYRGCVL